MALRRFSTSNITTGSKSSKLWDGETFPGYFESIQTVIVGSAGAANVEFTNIPNNYAHLQVRGFSRDTRAVTVNTLAMRLGNGSIDTGSNYTCHHLWGDGSTVTSGYSINDTSISFMVEPGASASTGVFAGVVIDILDYANTNKFKTTRTLNASDINGSGYIGFSSGVWRSTSAVTNIQFFTSGSGNFVQYSQFALYGIRSA